VPHVARFYHRYGHYEVETFSGEQALTTAIYTTDVDQDNEAFSHIDVYEDGQLVRTLTSEEVFEQLDRNRPKTTGQRAVAEVEIRGSDGKWASECGYVSVDGAETVAGRLAGMFGADNVRVRRIPFGG
jgi:hypothetical protein